MRLFNHICAPALILLMAFAVPVFSQVDVSCLSIDAPSINALDCTTLLSQNESISVTIRNEANASILSGTFLQFDVRVNGAIVLSEFFALVNDLNSGATLPLTLVGKVDLSALGNHTLDVTCLAPMDANPANDMASITYSNPGALPQTVGYVEDFNSLPSNGGAFSPTIFDVPPGWNNDGSDAASLAGNTVPDWAPNDNTTGSNQGPLADHSTGAGIYMYLEDSPSQVGDVELSSPCLDTQSAQSQPRASFWYVSRESAGSTADNILNIDIVDEDSGGVVTLAIVALPGNGSTDWVRQSIDLSAFAPSRVRVIFRANNNNGTFTDDIAIDVFSFFDFVPGLGQAPRTSIATFDMNGALNATGDNIATDAKGPYFASMTVGANLNMSWSGSPNQPMACLYGNMNLKSATYGAAIGQTDIGGPGVDVNGYPLNLQIFGDGFAWLRNPGFSNQDAFFFTGSSGIGGFGAVVPNLGLPPGTVVTSMQCLMADPVAPFFRLSNAIELTVF